MIAEGRIAIDGERLTTPATLLENLKGVTVDGQPVKPPTAARLFCFYKPAGTLTAARDPKGRPTLAALAIRHLQGWPTQLAPDAERLDDERRRALELGARA